MTQRETCSSWKAPVWYCRQMYCWCPGTDSVRWPVESSSHWHPPRRSGRSSHRSCPSSCCPWSCPPVMWGLTCCWCPGCTRGEATRVSGLQDRGETWTTTETASMSARTGSVQRRRCPRECVGLPDIIAVLMTDSGLVNVNNIPKPTIKSIVMYLRNIVKQARMKHHGRCTLLWTNWTIIWHSNIVVKMLLLTTSANSIVKLSPSQMNTIGSISAPTSQGQTNTALVRAHIPLVDCRLTPDISVRTSLAGRLSTDDTTNVRQRVPTVTAGPRTPTRRSVEGLTRYLPVRCFSSLH